MKVKSQDTAPAKPEVDLDELYCSILNMKSLFNGLEALASSGYEDSESMVGLALIGQRYAIEAGEMIEPKSAEAQP